MVKMSQPSDKFCPTDDSAVPSRTDRACRLISFAQRIESQPPRQRSELFIAGFSLTLVLLLV
jgi:hypothetical protein